MGQDRKIFKILKKIREVRLEVLKGVSKVYAILLAT
jgi:hypothetical protein